MATSNQTPNFGLSQYAANDPVKFLTNYNEDMVKIDQSSVPNTRKIAGINLQDDILLSELVAAGLADGTGGAANNALALGGVAAAGVIKGANLLHNWYFPNPVNQRGVSGTISTLGYFIDSWNLTSGSVTLTSNGLTLNGTITQILEYTAGTDVTASVSMYSGTATAAYNNGTKTLTITSSGGTIRAAKLEKGTVSTLANDAPPDYGELLALCQRYQVLLSPFIRFRTVGYTAEYLDFFVPTPRTMRITPAIIRPENLTVRTITQTPQTGFSFAVVVFSANGVLIRATKTAHGLTDAQMTVESGGAILDSNL